MPQALSAHNITLFQAAIEHQINLLEAKVTKFSSSWDLVSIEGVQDITPHLKIQKDNFHFLYMWLADFHKCSSPYAISKQDLERLFEKTTWTQDEFDRIFQKSISDFEKNLLSLIIDYNDVAFNENTSQNYYLLQKFQKNIFSKISELYSSYQIFLSQMSSLSSPE